MDHAINEIKKDSKAEQNTLRLGQIDEISLKSGFIRLGHPTVAFQFDSSGKASPASVLIAGELYFANNTWYLSDLSGRYNHIQTHRPVKRKLLEMVAEQLHASTKTIDGIGITATIDIIHKLKTPDSIWERYTKKSLHSLGKFEIAKVLILKAIKYSISNQFDEKLGEIPAKYTAEFKAIKHWMAGLPYNKLKDYVDYCRTQAFLDELKSIFQENKQPVPKDLAKNINEYVEFLSQKVKEEQHVGCAERRTSMGSNKNCFPRGGRKTPANSLDPSERVLAVSHK